MAQTIYQIKLMLPIGFCQVLTVWLTDNLAAISVRGYENNWNNWGITPVNFRRKLQNGDICSEQLTRSAFSARSGSRLRAARFARTKSENRVARLAGCHDENSFLCY